MTLQSTPRKSVTRGASVARRLVASTSIAAHVLNATIEDFQVEKPVQRCRAEVGFVCGQAVILAGDVFYLVASKFEHRFYVLTQRNGRWQCSSREATVATRCIAQVEAMRGQSRKLAA